MSKQIFIKWTPLWIQILCRKLFKIFLKWTILGRLADRQYARNSPQYGPKVQELGFLLIKLTPIQFGFCTIYYCKIFKLVHLWPIGRPPIFQNGLQYGAPNTYERGLQQNCWSQISKGPGPASTVKDRPPSNPVIRVRLPRQTIFLSRVIKCTHIYGTAIYWCQRQKAMKRHLWTTAVITTFTVRKGMYQQIGPMECKL